MLKFAINIFDLTPEQNKAFQPQTSTGNPKASSTVSSRQVIGLVVLGLALAITIIDSTIVNIALPSIQKDFSISVNDLEWISAIYALFFGSFLLTWGKLSDEFGRRRIFMIGVATFIIGSTITGVSNSLATMLVGRAIQGFGAAMATPSTLSILTTTFTGKARGVAFGIWGAVAGAAGAFGPILGGYFTTYYSWRWAFLINVPIGLVALIGAIVVVQESKFRDPKYTTDFGGVTLIALSLSSILFGFIEAQTYGWLVPNQTFALGSFTWPFSNISISAVSIIAGFILLGGFVLFESRRQKKGKVPLMDFSLFKFRGFRFGVLTVLIVAMGEFGVLFFLSIYFQVVRGLTAINTGITFLPLAFAAFFFAPAAGLLSNKFGPKWIVTTGMILEATALYGLWQITQVSNPLYTFYPILFIYGAGIGLAIGQLTNTVLMSIPWQKAGIGSGVNSTFRQIGSAFGVAVIGAVLVAEIAAVGKADLAASAIIPDYLKSILQGVLNSGLQGRVTPSIPSGSGPLQTAITSVFDDAITQGTRWAAFTAALFVTFGAISSLFIPNSKKSEQSKSWEAVPKDTSMGERSK